MSILLVGLGGAFGSIARYLMATWLNRVTQLFPVGTFAVNVAGSLIVGLLTGYLLNTQTHPLIRPALVVGFCGGFTTFSTFSMETVALANSGEMLTAVAYAAGSVICCVCGAAVGFSLGRPAGT